MRILLVSPNRASFPYRVTPLGLLYLAAALKRHGHEAILTDLMFSKAPLDDLSRQLTAFRPNLVGISLRNVDSVASKEKSSLSFYAECVETVRRATRAPLVLGGPGLTAFTETFMDRLRPDYALAGDAIRSFPMLLRKLEQAEDPSQVPGLAWFDGDELRQNPPDYVQDPGELPHQAIELIDYRQYMRNRAMFGIVTQRGCPHNCIFCDERRICGPGLRFRAVKLVVDEIEHIRQRTGMKYFAFADPAFNCNRAHMVGVLRELLRRGLDIRFQCELNPLNQDEEVVSLLARAGCIGVDFTCDTGSESMSRNLEKGFSPKTALKVAGLYARHEIPYTAGFLLGGPGENRETVAETIAFAEALPGPRVVYFSVGLTILPYSNLAAASGEESVCKDPDDAMETLFYLSKAFDEECARMVQDACDRNPSFFVSDCFYQDSVRGLFSLLDWVNLRPAYKYKHLNECGAKLLPSRIRSMVWDAPRRRFVSAYE